MYLMRRDYLRARRMHDAEEQHKATMDTYDRHFGK